MNSRGRFSRTEGFRALRLTAAAFGILGLTAAAMAQQQARAARLSDLDGNVQLTQGGQVISPQAVPNTPLFEGTQIATAEDGRAELQFDDGSIARLAPNSALLLSAMRQQDGTSITQVVLESGLAYFELQGTSSSGQFAVQFGSNTVSASGFTVLRVDVDNPPGALAVFSGNAHLDGAGGLALDLHGGESATLSAAAAGSYQLAESIEPDSWDAWNSDRDQAISSEEAQRTVATNNVPDASNPAWSDLDANGNWYNVPGQGYVWSPYVAESASWDPYGCGSWVWTPAYGYIWASCEPWGYMPYAMGMWGYYDGIGWGWMPGGGYGWGGGGGVNVSRTPFRYEPPKRPRGGPVNPHDPRPSIAVNRFRGGETGTPVRPRGGPVTIAGTTIKPLAPVGTRTVYNHEPSVAVGGGYRTAFGTPASPTTPHSGFMPTHGTEMGATIHARPVYTPPAPGSRPNVYGAGNMGGYGAHPSAPYNGFAGRAPAPTGGRNSFGAVRSAPPPRSAPSAPHFSPPPAAPHFSPPPAAASHPSGGSPHR
ncbi:MAG TPA: DUF6600 domain-containing protein [Terracidiphilus sp.]|nr:DUF6600 domain-containing protein [Terracidiphilus sp.]